jgi:serine/threonine protein kinase
MHLLWTVIVAGLVQQAATIPLDPKSLLGIPSRSLRGRNLVHSTLPTDYFFELANRGVPPTECAVDTATEEDGCFTLQDASESNVRFALAPGKSFVKEQSLGAGVFGGVYACVLKDGQDIAVKLYKSPDHGGAKKSFGLLKELEGNEHIVKAVAWGKVQGKPALAMELAPDGTVESRNKDKLYEGKEKEGKLKETANQLLDGLAYMHSKKIAHTDLHEGNIAFKGDIAKVVDFDHCKKDIPIVIWVNYDWRAAPGKLRNRHMLRHLANTGLEASFDRIAGNGPNQIDVYKNDVWDLASIFIRMMKGHEDPDFPDTNSQEIREIWENDDADKRVELMRKRWPDFTPEFVELLADIYCKQDQRISMEQFKEDFKDVQIYC